MEPKIGFAIDLIGASVFMLAAMIAVVLGARSPGAAPATVALLLFAFAFAFSGLSTILGVAPGASGGALLAFAFMCAAIMAGVGFAVAAVAVSI